MTSPYPGSSLMSGEQSGGAVYRTARKDHPCANSSRAKRGVEWAQVCKLTIAHGERYLEGEMDLDYAGGFGRLRYCMSCAEAGLA